MADNEPASELGRCWSCPNCAFTFAAEHTDHDGGHSCPACAEHDLRARLAEIAAVRDEWRDRPEGSSADLWDALNEALEADRG